MPRRGDCVGVAVRTLEKHSWEDGNSKHTIECTSIVFRHDLDAKLFAEFAKRLFR